VVAAVDALKEFGAVEADWLGGTAQASPGLAIWVLNTPDSTRQFQRGTVNTRHKLQQVVHPGVSALQQGARPGTVVDRGWPGREAEERAGIEILEVRIHQPTGGPRATRENPVINNQEITHSSAQPLRTFQGHWSC
jgi:hypothetical protein